MKRLWPLIASRATQGYISFAPNALRGGRKGWPARLYRRTAREPSKVRSPGPPVEIPACKARSLIPGRWSRSSIDATAYTRSSSLSLRITMVASYHLAGGRGSLLVHARPPAGPRSRLDRGCRRGNRLDRCRYRLHASEQWPNMTTCRATLPMRAWCMPASQTRVREIWTLDQDFLVFRLPDRTRFTLIPGGK